MAKEKKNDNVGKSAAAAATVESEEEKKTSEMKKKFPGFAEFANPPQTNTYNNKQPN